MDPDYWWDAVEHLKPSRAGERKASGVNPPGSRKSNSRGSGKIPQSIF